MATMEEIQQSIFETLTAYEPTAEGIDDEAEKAEFDKWMAEQLASLANAEAEKADAYCYAIRHAEAEADFFRREAERFQQRRTYVESHIQRMKERITYIMREFDLKEIKGDRYKLALRKSTHVVVEVDPAKLPREFIRIKPEVREPDKKAIGDALKAGTEIGGARLEDSWSVQIR